jgi:hypothetical protein
MLTKSKKDQDKKNCFNTVFKNKEIPIYLNNNNVYSWVELLKCINNSEILLDLYRNFLESDFEYVKNILTPDLINIKYDHQLLSEIYKKNPEEKFNNYLKKELFSYPCLDGEIENLFRHYRDNNFFPDNYEQFKDSSHDVKDSFDELKDRSDNEKLVKDSSDDVKDSSDDVKLVKDSFGGNKKHNKTKKYKTKKYKTKKYKTKKYKTKKYNKTKKI